MTMNWYNTMMFILNKSCWPQIPTIIKKDVWQEIWMTFYESVIANQGRQTLAVRMFVETSGECSAVINLLQLGSKVCIVNDTS